MLTKPLAQYSHARMVGDLMFFAGQGCRNPETNSYAGVTRDDTGKVVSYDIAAQTRGVLSNIEKVLVSHGLTRQELVDVNVFLTDMKDFASMNDVWNAFFAECNPPPTRTTVAVKQLPGDNFIEMKSIATTKRGASL